jgi:predicted helicase
MAPGTGKTFSALALAEKIVPSGGLSCSACRPSRFCPKARGLGRSRRPLHCFAVCSDAQVTKDSEDMHVYFYYV